MDPSAVNHDAMLTSLNKYSQQLKSATADLNQVSNHEELQKIEKLIAPALANLEALNKALKQSKSEIGSMEAVIVSASDDANKQIQETRAQIVHIYQRLNRQSRVASHLIGAVDRQYDSIEGELVGKHTGYKTGMNKEQMHEIITKVSHATADFKESESLILKFNQNLEILVHKAPGQNIEVIFLPNASLYQGTEEERERFRSIFLLGSGSFAQNFAAHSLNEDQRLALKILDKTSSSRKDDTAGITNAYEKFRFIESLGGSSGIVGPRLHLVAAYDPTFIPGQGSKTSPVGVMVAAPRGICDLRAATERGGLFAQLSLKERLKTAIPLFEALCFLKKNGLIHGDIDASNVIVLQKPDQTLQLAFIDLDEMCFLGEKGLDVTKGIKGRSYHNPEVGTLFHHITRADSEAMKEALAEKNQDAYNAAQYSREMRSLGMSVSAFFGNLKEKFSDIFVKEFIKLVDRMRHEDPAKRLTPEQALQALHNIIDL